MARRCELTGKGVMTGNRVSHANNKNKRQFKPNLCNVSLASDILEDRFSFKVSASALRTVEHNGGLDSYLTKAKAAELSPKAKLLKKKIESKATASA